jgi:hypothetical protein
MSNQNRLKDYFERPRPSFTPFQAELLLFCESLSEMLFRLSDHKEEPDWIALAFWLRKGHLAQLQKRFQQKGSPRSPRGIVFHIPPANIDVMLVYSWICSLLVGNQNIIRIPSSRPARADRLLKIIFTLLEEQRFQAIREGNLFVDYGHDDQITRLISSQVDVRLIWGGDETISLIRNIPLQPDAIEIAFPDRFSYGAIDAESFLSSNVEQVVTNFFNDIYWFDQSACSSPRLLFWVGGVEQVAQASDLFYSRLQQLIRQRGYQVSLGGALLKKTYLYSQALDLPVEKVAQYSNELSVLYLTAADPHCRIHCGQGLLYHLSIASLDQIASFATHKDQTLVTHGFSPQQLMQLAKALNGKGITRMVTPGQALSFDPIWDGQDLFYALTQQTFIEGAV